jgi:orotidine-5'-phosphate decarboxylase
VPTLREATDLARQAAGALAAVKIGSQLFTAAGPAAVRAMQDLGLPVFLDLKFHDIPNTVGAAVAAARDLGVWMLNVHGSAGPAALAAAAGAVGPSPNRPLVVAVTVLTSFTDEELQTVWGAARTLAGQVRHLACQALQAGLDGVVASPHEIRLVREACGPSFLIVTPGVRPAGADVQDQRRVMTPREAIRAGADYVVVGRPISGAPDPAAAARRIAEECRQP